MRISNQKLDFYRLTLYNLGKWYLTEECEEMTSRLSNQIIGMLETGDMLGILDITSGAAKLVSILEELRKEVLTDWSKGVSVFCNARYKWQLIVDDAFTEEAYKTLGNKTGAE